MDTGLHAKHWTRQQAIDFMLAHSAMPLPEIENEVDRYVAMPAQALSYMVGKLEILAAREEAKRALGDRFSMPAFHDQLLGSGSLPLATMRNMMSRWVKGQMTPK